MQPGDEVGGYRIVRALGAGGMGAVFEAQRSGSASVALKVLLSGADPEVLARFEREARVLRELSSPGIVRLLDYGSDQGRPYLVQELCPEGDLAAHLRRRGTLPVEEARGVLLALCEALAAAHSVGVVHRDLKPANVLLEAGRPKLTDFGLARAKGIDRASLTETGVFLGTPAYMAPEQLLDAREVDERSDVYALGVILYELLSGRRPFGGSSPLAIADAVLNLEPPPLPDSVPGELRAAVSRALAKDPSERFASARELAAALAPPALGASPGGGLSPLAVGSLALTGLLLCVVVGLFAPQEDPLQDPREGPPSSALAQASLGSPSPTRPEQSATPPGPDSGALEEALTACHDPDQLAAAVARVGALARSGDPDAQLAYARFLMAGFGCAPERAQAQELLDEAARAGSSEALVLRACAEPPQRWERAQVEMQERVLARLQEGDPGALRLVALDQPRYPPGHYGFVLEAAREPGPLRDLDAFRRAREDPSPAGIAEVLGELRRSDTTEALLIRGKIALGQPEPLRTEPELATLLERAARRGSAQAGALLGNAICSERIPGELAEGRRWQEWAALRGRADVAFERWRRDRGEVRWLRLSAAHGFGPALVYYAEHLVEQGDPSAARAWLKVTWRMRREARAAGLLAELLRGEEPRDSLLYAKEGAKAPDRDSLRTYAEIILEPQAAISPKPWRALEVLGGLAALGDGEAALRAAEVALRIKLPVRVARALLRRAYAQPETRAAAADELRRLTTGIAETAPLRSQSQLVLSARAEAGDRGAIVEIARRASLELVGEARYRAMAAAAATGDLESRLSLARWAVSAKGPTAEVRAEFAEIAAAGLHEAALYSLTHEPGKLGAVLRRLQPLAEAGDVEAEYAYGVGLGLRPATREEGLRWVERAAEGGLEKARDYVLSTRLRRRAPDLDALEQEAQVAVDGFHLGLVGATLARAKDPQSQMLGRRSLTIAAIQGAPPHVLVDLANYLLLQGEISSGTATLWLDVAQRQGHGGAQVILGRLYLSQPSVDWQETGFRLVEAAARRGHAGARVALGVACLRGEGTRVDIDRAERELRPVAAGSPEARVTLAEIAMARGRGPEALEMLRRELQSGNAYARPPLAKMHLSGVAGRKDPDAGLRLLREGVEKREVGACLFLADLYAAGDFVPRDPRQAGRLRKIASEIRRAKAGGR